MDLHSQENPKTWALQLTMQLLTMVNKTVNKNRNEFFTNATAPTKNNCKEHLQRTTTSATNQDDNRQRQQTTTTAASTMGTTFTIMMTTNDDNDMQQRR